jgi:predicted transcriptional regulator
MINGKSMHMSGVANRILLLLKESPRQTPISIAGRLNASVSTIRNALVILSDLKLVEAKVRGLYEITPLGERLLKDTSRAK